MLARDQALLWILARVDGGARSSSLAQAAGMTVHGAASELA